MRTVAPALSVLLAAAAIAGEAEMPPVPVGLDAYRQWERWPQQRIGVRAYMRSTYDRRGGNERADAAHYLYQLANDRNVSLDVSGAGILYFARYNHWHGSPWHYVVDGRDHLITETSTVNPLQPAKDSVFEPAHLFPRPLTFTWSTTKGADLMWVPIPFEQSFRMEYSRTFYGTGYYIYHQFVPGTKLSQPLRAWDGATPPGADVVALLSRAGTDLAPGSSTRQSGSLPRLGPEETLPVVQLSTGPTMLRKLAFSVPEADAIGFGRARLRVAWDDRRAPSIEAPVALFFGAGTLYNRDQREYLVKAFPVHIRYRAGRVELACYFPMPFFRSARMELIGAAGEHVRDIRWSVAHERFAGARNHVGYFHATYRDHLAPVRGQDLVLLDTRETEGGGDWSGSFVGTSWTFSDRAILNTLEGDPRFFFDDSQSPQAYGTGTEEWGGGGDYWGGQNMTLPFAGHPVGARNAKEAKSDEDLIQSAYRFLLADLMPFGRNAVIRLEHGGRNQSEERYRTVTYWYGADTATLLKTDELKVGDSESERLHRYRSPDASAPYTLRSRYELGPDSEDNGAETPSDNPRDYAEFEFEAEAGKPYHVWVRGRDRDERVASSSFWLQFDEQIGTRQSAPKGVGARPYRYGAGNWLDDVPRRHTWSSGVPGDPPMRVTFPKPGRHRLRLQPRHGCMWLEQVWLSTTQAGQPGATTHPASKPPGEIVLGAADAVVRRGSIELVEDGEARQGRVLEIGEHTPGKEYYPAHTDVARKTTGTSEFTLRIDPRNVGVMLRRKLDYAFPNQRAEVHIASGDGAAENWQPAGVWYTAGSNMCIFSDPAGELGAAHRTVQTSNRRFRDDEFLLPRALTEGRSAIRVRVTFTPADIPLFPGRRLPEQAWTEIRYDAYCFVVP